MQYKDMREYLAFLEEDGQLKHLDTPLRAGRDNPDLQALMRYLHDENNLALILNGLQDYNTPDVPLIFNPFGTRERTGLTMGIRDPLEAKAAHPRILGDRSAWLEPTHRSKQCALQGCAHSRKRSIPG
jgi:UbiD family decarboxylase